VKLADIEKHVFVLTPGRYVGAAETEEDGEPLDEKMKHLTALLRQHYVEGSRLDTAIATNLRKLGYGG
jgi:type I restriction enzyme M protein